MRHTGLQLAEAHGIEHFEIVFQTMQRDGFEQRILFGWQLAPAGDLSAAHIAEAPLLHDDRRTFLGFAFFEHGLEAF
ncbi:hypothetical protein D3C76_1407110 [compost metagenome]